MPQTKVRRTYKEKIAEFNEAFGPFEFVEVEDNEEWCCDACGSHFPGHYYLYQDKNGNIRHVGSECHTNLITTWKGGRCEGCRAVKTVTMTKVKLPSGIEVVDPLCEECASYLEQSCPERERIYHALEERHSVKRR